ncbi:hypothetical protein JDW15_10135 [Aerococcaceae bacterium zg-ZJ1578]|uniref:hypothetical protein n=1 Tax=Aerococcaceae bacterium zg-252 TaxID=2796928 RepID=UPI001A2BB96B|nr:hypothetical protein [Aerococcaceae bacterium zg-1578]MBR7928488.1 hypothetical protein [Aerococcaceae bacterium zg-ZUI334]
MDKRTIEVYTNFKSAMEKIDVTKLYSSEEVYSLLQCSRPTFNKYLAHNDYFDKNAVLSYGPKNFYKGLNLRMSISRILEKNLSFFLIEEFLQVYKGLDLVVKDTAKKEMDDFLYQNVPYEDRTYTINEYLKMEHMLSDAENQFLMNRFQDALIAENIYPVFDENIGYSEFNDDDIEKYWQKQLDSKLLN